MQKTDLKPMVPTYEEARALALCLCEDSTLNAMQRSAAANLVNFIERSAGPALEAEKNNSFIVEARIVEWENLISGEFKPALLEAVNEVLSEIATTFLNEAIVIRETVKQAAE